MTFALQFAVLVAITVTQRLQTSQVGRPYPPVNIRHTERMSVPNRSDTEDAHTHPPEHFGWPQSSHRVSILDCLTRISSGTYGFKVVLFFPNAFPAPEKLLSDIALDAGIHRTDASVVEVKLER